MKPTSLLIALPLGLLFAGAAMAQQPTTQQDPTTTQDQQQSQDMQMERDRARSDSTMQHDRMNPAARSAARNPTFDQLDSQHHGYLMRTDVRRDAWLASHFSQCDTNSDAQLSRSEYDACRR